jgi:DNA-directed RNA polymerase subunit F
MKNQIPRLLFTIAVSILVFPASATSTETEFSDLAKARKFAELESLAREKLAKNSKDDVALWYLGRFAAGDAKKREELIPRAEQCIKVLPQSARCHSTLGSLYGAAAISAGITAGLKYAGNIKEMFQKAVELDPKHFDMRRDLNQFYLQAPGLAGGSVRKAIQNSTDFAKVDPARAQLLRAEVHIYEKEFDKAEAIIANIKPGPDADLADILRGATSTLGFAMINANASPKAQKLFERQIAADITNANAHFGLGRSLLEQKQIDAAIASMERALQMDPKLNAHYRLGIAYQSKGDKPKAAAMYKQFLTYSTQGRAADDARKRLEELKIS